MKAIEKPWIEQGYRTFAYEGPIGLKVERLAKAVGKNKSSFYHLFADLEVFTNRLLAHHLAQSEIIAEKEAQCSNLDALISVLVVHKVDLLFSRQLRIHRENKAFSDCFQASNARSLPAILPLWAEMLDLGDASYLAELVLQLSLENFFLQITDETLNEAWLQQYFRDIKTMVRHFKQAGKTSTLDGAV